MAFSQRLSPHLCLFYFKDAVWAARHEKLHEFIFLFLEAIDFEIGHGLGLTPLSL